MRTWRHTIAAAVVVACAVTLGCTVPRYERVLVHPVKHSVPANASRASVSLDQRTLELEALAEHLELVEDLQTASKEDWQALHDDALRRQRTSPGPEPDLRLALTLGTVRRPIGDLEKARDTLMRLLEQDAALSPQLRRLAQSRFTDVVRRIEIRKQLQSSRKQLERLEGDLAQCGSVATEQEEANRELLQTRELKEEAELALSRCNDALAEADEKLRAVTSIEKTIDQPNGQEATP